MFSRAARAAVGAVACWATLGGGPSDAGAAEPWLRVRGDERCSAAPEALAQRIREAALGTADPELAVEVIVSGGARTTARVRLTLGSRSIGSKELEANTCDEMLDAITTVVALALSSESQASAAPSPAKRRTELALEPASEAADAPRAPSEHTRRVSAAPADELAAHDELGGDTSRWRVLLGVGMDRGSLSEATLVMRAGLVASLGAGELRAVAAYGVPSVREEVSDVFRSERTDFAAAALDYCHGLDAERWVSACAGLELGVRRHSRVEQAPEEARVLAERLEPSTSALAGLAFVYRDATVQPELDVMAQRPLLGALAEAPPLGFRAALGAAVQF